MAEKISVVDGSTKRRNLRVLDQASQPMPVKKVGLDKPQHVNNQLIKLNHNREWLARQLNTSTSDLNRALQPGTPSGSENRLADRAVKFLDEFVKKTMDS
jgi:hypothetical protein